MPKGYPNRVFGVDFSGAVDAGTRIWIAGGLIEGRRLRVEECYRADGLPGSGRDRDLCLGTLRDLIRGNRDCAFGIDFPFGLPAELIGEASWGEFVRGFSRRYPTPEGFRTACLAATGGREAKRLTDRESGTPFSPYNLRVYRQTYFGIRDLLVPLLANGSACVLPMQPRRPGRAWILEVCPASALKQQKLYVPYKGPTWKHRRNRERIVTRIKDMEGVAGMAPGVRQTALENSSGDALDSVIAGVAAFRSLLDPAGLMAGNRAPYVLEGYVYC